MLDLNIRLIDYNFAWNFVFLSCHSIIFMPIEDLIWYLNSQVLSHRRDN